MNDRTGQTWEEHGSIFVVVAPAELTDDWRRHPVRFLDKAANVRDDERHVDEGEIPWESHPYMTRIS